MITVRGKSREEDKPMDELRAHLKKGPLGMDEAGGSQKAPLGRR